MSNGYHVFIDESESQPDKLVVLGAVLIRDVDLRKINKDMDTLRASIGRSMRRHKYVIYSENEEDLFTGSMRTESRRLRAGGLPEIHTQHLWRSSNEYYTPASNMALERRNNWLYSVTQIFTKYPVIFMTRRFEGKFREFHNTSLENALTALENVLAHDVSRRKVKEMLNDIHFSICFELFLKLDSLSEVGIKILSVTCDKGKRTERYQHFLGFDTAREYDHWLNFPNPTFESSHGSNGLQLADFATYLQMKTMYPKGDLGYIGEIYPLIHRMHKNFQTTVGHSTRYEATKPSERHSSLMVAMFYEAALLHCGGRLQTLPARQAALKRLLRQTLQPINGYSKLKMVEAQVASYKGPVWVKDTTWLEAMQSMNEDLIRWPGPENWT